MDSKLYNSLAEAYTAVYQEGVRDVDPEKGTAERKAKLEKKRGMKLDDHPQYKKEEVESEAYEPMTKERQMKVDRAKKKAFDADHRAQSKNDSAEADKQFKRRMAMDSRTKMRKEELDIFDTVLEFLYAEGYVDTAEEAEWMMANLIDKEAIDIILGEDSRRMSNKQHTARVRSNIKSFGKNYTPPSNYDPDANRGQGEVLTRKQIEKKRRKALRQEEFKAWFDEAMMEADSLAAMQARREKRLAAQRKREGTTSTGRDFGHDYSRTPAQQKARRDAEYKAGMKKEEVEEVDEAMSSYDRNRKRAAQRAADRNAARAAGKTGVVPGVGYVSPRKERETYTDEKGTVRHKSGAKMP